MPPTEIYRCLPSLFGGPQPGAPPAKSDGDYEDRDYQDKQSHPQEKDWRPIFEARIPSPHWTTPYGAECEAMGIAGLDLLQHGGHLDLRVEIAVGDVCETGGRRWAIIETPLR